MTPKNQKSKARPAPSHVEGTYVAGNFNVKGNYYRDQVNIHFEDRRTAHLQLVTELKGIQLQLQALRQQPALDAGDQQTVEVIAGRVEQALQEAQKDEPLAERVQSALEKAAALMNSLSLGVDAALGLGQRLAAVALMAKAIFGL